MGGWHRSLITAVAILAAATAADARGTMGGRGAAGGHGFHGFHGRSFALQFGPHNFRTRLGFGRFGNARFEGWNGGAYSGDVAGFDDDEDDFAPEDLHFRVQESFGPGDIGRPPPAPEPYENTPWADARMDPWHGYQSDDSW